MRKLSLLLLACTMTAVTQAASLSFRGIPIKGHLGKFLLKMKDEGFSPKGAHDDSVMFSGISNDRNINLVVYSNPATENVTSLDVIYPAGSEWNEMEQLFNDLCKALTAKYGNPTSTARDWNNSYYADKLSAMLSHELLWKNTYSLKGGRITCNLYQDNFWGSVVVVRYENVSKKEQNKNYVKDL